MKNFDVRYKAFTLHESNFRNLQVSLQLLPPHIHSLALLLLTFEGNYKLNKRVTFTGITSVLHVVKFVSYIPKLK